MNHAPSHQRGLRFTLRHQIILVAWLSVLFAVLSHVLKSHDADLGRDVMRVVLLLSPWVLGLLILALDQPGPVRDWQTAAVLYWFYPALVIYHDVSIVRGAIVTGHVPNLLPAVVFNLLILGSSAVFYQRMRPCRCPSCGDRALIPLIRLTGQSRRILQTRWCASCGQLFWRDATGAWRVERRATWMTPHVSVGASVHAERPPDEAEHDQQPRCQPVG